MTDEAIMKIVTCLDNIEAALDDIAVSIGHPTFKEWLIVQKDN